MLNKKFNLEFVIILIILLGILIFVQSDYAGFEHFAKCKYEKAPCIGERTRPIYSGDKFVFAWDYSNASTSIDATSNGRKESKVITACWPKGDDCEIATGDANPDRAGGSDDLPNYYTCPAGKASNGCNIAFGNFYQKAIGEIGPLKSYKDLGYLCDINIAGTKYQSTIPLKYENNILTCASGDGVNCLKRTNYTECKTKLDLVPNVDLSKYLDSQCKTVCNEFTELGPNLLVNGDFEQVIVTADSSNTNTGVPGWTFGSSAYLLNNSKGKNTLGYPAYPNGVQIITIQKTGSITQTGINLVAGKKYTLSFFACARPYKKVGNEIAIKLTGPTSSDTPVLNIKYTPPSYTMWSSKVYSINNVIKTGTYTLSFTGLQTTNDYSTGLDLISLMATPSNPNSSKYLKYSGTNSSGNDLVIGHNVDNLSQCKNECADRKDCAGFVTNDAGKVVKTIEQEFYNGKKVLSRTERVINGKTYEDIKVVSGEIFTNPK